MEDNRKYGLDLLRILSMVMVIGLHYNFNCGISVIESFGLNFSLMWIIEAICYVSVDCFVLISGYFGVKSKKTNYRRLISLLSATWFYSWFFLIVFMIVAKGKISLGIINSSLFPIINGHYWFITVYIMMALFQPFLNKSFDSMVNNKKWIWYIALLLLFCIIPTFFPKADTNLKLDGGTNLIWFTTLYFTGGLIRHNESNAPKKTLFFAGFLIGMVIPITVKLAAMKFLGMNQGGAVFYHHNNLFIFIAAISLFCIFKDIAIKPGFISKLINWVAPTCFGIYLIHENINLKTLLWAFISKVQPLDSLFWALFVIFAIVVIFVACSFIEKLRIFIFDRLKIEDFCYRLSEQIITRIRQKFVRR